MTLSLLRGWTCKALRSNVIKHAEIIKFTALPPFWVHPHQVRVKILFPCVSESTQFRRAEVTFPCVKWSLGSYSLTGLVCINKHPRVLLLWDIGHIASGPVWFCARAVYWRACSIVGAVWMVILFFLHSYCFSSIYFNWPYNSKSFIFRGKENKCKYSTCSQYLRPSFWDVLVLLFVDWDLYNLSPSVQFCHSVVSDSLRPHEPQHTRPPYASNPIQSLSSLSYPIVPSWTH